MPYAKVNKSTATRDLCTINTLTVYSLGTVGIARMDHLLNPRLMLCSKYQHTVYPKKYAHGFCFAVLCCGHTLTDFPISIRLTSLALWQSNDLPQCQQSNPDEYG